MNQAIDLDFRPRTYFGPHRLEQHLLAQVKGAVLRDRLRVLFAEGRHDEVMGLLADGGISERDRKALEAMHPMFMGGNYLPDTAEGEVEIARIRISPPRRSTSPASTPGATGTSSDTGWSTSTAATRSRGRQRWSRASR